MMTRISGTKFHKHGRGDKDGRKKSQKKKKRRKETQGCLFFGEQNFLHRHHFTGMQAIAQIEEIASINTLQIAPLVIQIQCIIQYMENANLLKPSNKTKKKQQKKMQQENTGMSKKFTNFHTNSSFLPNNSIHK